MFKNDAHFQNYNIILLTTSIYERIFEDHEYYACMTCTVSLLYLTEINKEISIDILSKYFRA